MKSFNKSILVGISVLFLTTNLFGIDNKFYNPNGKPFTLSLGYNLEGGTWSAILPISKYVTISMFDEFHYDINTIYSGNEHGYLIANSLGYIDAEIYDNDDNHYDYTIHFDTTGLEHTVVYDKYSIMEYSKYINFKFEVHLPLYKLWE